MLVVFGTRPEAIKLSPVILHMQGRPAEFAVVTCATAQHREMLDRVLAAFGVEVDHDLDIMRPNQTLAESTSRMIAALDPVVRREQPDLILVQGDTTTTFCGALSGFYHKVPVGHVEAGLRTGDLWSPFPEEANRVLTTRLTALHFAPTESAAANLRAEGVDERSVFVTGNPGIDAVLRMRDRLAAGQAAGCEWRGDPGKKLIVVTAHRRESFGQDSRGSAPRSRGWHGVGTWRSSTRFIRIRMCGSRQASVCGGSPTCTCWSRWTTWRLWTCCGGPICC